METIRGLEISMCLERQPILIIETHTDSIIRIARSLSQRNFHLVFESTTSTGWSRYIETRPILVFVALQNDSLHENISFIRQIRQLDSNTVLCALASNDSPLMMLDCLLAGANHFLCKSTSDRLFFECINQIVDTDAIQHCSFGSYLRSKKLLPSQIELLKCFADEGFPDLTTLSDITGIRENTLVKRLSRIEQKLGLPSREALASLLTIARRFSPPRKVESALIENEVQQRDFVVNSR